VATTSEFDESAASRADTARPQRGGVELTDDQQRSLRAAVPETMSKTPYLSGLGIRFDAYAPDEVTVRLPFREDLTNDGTYYHGGVIAAVMDTTGAAAAWSNHDFSKGTRASTVSMTIQYVGAAKRSDLLCRARTVRRGKELTFTEITATDEAGAVVAHGLQTYRIV
jgi:uncharacterized protein (TIGR00369 family)